MNDKNIEEKAMQYVSNVDFSNSTGVYIENEMKGTTYKGYVDGYTQAEQDQSDTLTQYKEALRELVKMCKDFGIDDYYLYPEMQNAVKLLSDDSK